MTLNTLQSEMILAMKNKDKDRKLVLSELVDSVKKAAIDKNCRNNITEAMVDEVLLKYKKTVQEMIDTCPSDRIETLENYKKKMSIVTEFAPTLIDDEAEIRYLVLDIINNEIEFSKANRGKIMKTVTPVLKSKANMSVVSKVVANMLEG